MNRKPKIDPPKVIKPIEKDGYVKQVRKYKLITPLYGGGEEPNRPDSVTVIRGSEVRGHLRFWWRATRGGEFNGNLEDMKAAEEKIWGSSAGEGKAGPSEVKINVKVTNRGKDDPPFEVAKNKKDKLIIKPRDGSSVPAYAAFPLQPKKDDLKQVGQRTAAVKVGVEFRLELSYPEKFDTEIQASLWAWETFGGIGGRTRRGFGALQLTEKIKGTISEEIPLYDAKNAETSLKKDLENNVSSGNWPEDTPHLVHNLRFKIVQPSSKDAWLYLIERYQNFRQHRHKKLGKSLWPEANELRRRLGKPMNWKPEEIEKPVLVQKFPRAVFGLPILYHLPHDDDVTFTLQGKADPKTGKKYERLASVLILKPIPCTNGAMVGLAALLEAPILPPNGLEIKEPMDNKDPIEWKLDSNEARSEPLNRVLNGKTDVLQAFLDPLK